MTVHTIPSLLRLPRSSSLPSVLNDDIVCYFTEKNSHQMKISTKTHCFVFPCTIYFAFPLAFPWEYRLSVLLRPTLSHGLANQDDCSSDYLSFLLCIKFSSQRNQSIIIQTSYILFSPQLKKPSLNLISPSNCRFIFPLLKLVVGNFCP